MGRAVGGHPLHRSRSTLPDDPRRSGLDRDHRRPDARERAPGRDRRRARADRPRDARQPGPDPGGDPPAPAGAPERPEVGGSPRVAKELEDLAELTEEAYRDVREAILGLRESSRVDRGLVESLRAYLEKYSHQSGVKATLESTLGGEPALQPRTEVQVIRVIQEALTNVRKHSGAGSAVVRLSERDDAVRIVVEDDGRGFDLTGTLFGRDGYGLHTMRERMELIGGTLTIDSTPGSGTRVIATIPGVLHPQAAANGATAGAAASEANEVDTAAIDPAPSTTSLTDSGDTLEATSPGRPLGCRPGVPSGAMDRRPIRTDGSRRDGCIAPVSKTRRGAYTARRPERPTYANKRSMEPGRVIAPVQVHVVAPVPVRRPDGGRWGGTGDHPVGATARQPPGA